VAKKELISLQGVEGTKFLEAREVKSHEVERVGCQEATKKSFERRIRVRPSGD
jgi:hypothetical protein